MDAYLKIPYMYGKRPTAHHLDPLPTAVTASRPALSPPALSPPCPFPHASTAHLSRVTIFDGRQKMSHAFSHRKT
jgi:hypothetical protein